MMKKIILSILLLVAFLTIPFINVTKTAAADYSTSTKISNSNLLNGVIDNLGEAVELQDMKINVLQGDIFSEIKGFQNYIKASTTISDGTGIDNNTSYSAFNSWRIKSTSSSQAIYEIVAKNDIYLDITSIASKINSNSGKYEGDYLTFTGEYFGLYLKVNDTIYTQWERMVTELPVSETAYAGSIHLKAGDVCYYVFGFKYESAGFRTISNVPTFESSKSSYSETERNNQMNIELPKITEEKIRNEHAVTVVVNNNYEDADFELVKYGFAWGSIENMQPFSYHLGDGSGTSEDSLWDSVSQNAGFRRWQMHCAYGKDVFVKITAKEDAQFYVENNKDVAGAWAVHTGVRYYAVDSEGTRVLLKELYVVANMKIDYFALTVNLRAGESLIINYFTRNESAGVIPFVPVVKVNTELFDDSNLVDYNSVKVLDSLIDQKIAALNTLLDSLDDSNYSIANWGNIENYIFETITALELAQTEDEVNRLYSECVSNVDSVLTKDEAAADLNTYKDKKIKELEEFYSEINKENYSEENWKLISNKVNEIKTKISNATSKTAIDTILTSAKTFINNVATQEPAKNGCGGIVALSLFSIVCLAGAALTLRRKKYNK